MGHHHPLGRPGHPISMGTLGDVGPHRLTGGILHRDALGIGTLAKRCVLVVAQSKGHGHGPMVSK